MAYDFLGLTNEICGRLNETKLTSSNFSSAVNFYASIKDSINAAIKDVNHQEYNYPFNHNTAEIILEAGVARYALPQDAKTVDLNTIRIVRDQALDVATIILGQIQYNEYIRRYLDDETNSNTSGNVPTFVAKSRTNELALAPKPDKAYKLQLEYFVVPADLSSSEDVPSIPESFKHVIIDGAMYHCYMFRDNAQSATLAKQKFDEGLKAMRSLLVNEYINILDTRVERSSSTVSLRVS
jgi:hypothetical protein